MNLFYKRPFALFCFLFAATALGGCFLVSKQKAILGFLLLVVSLPLFAAMLFFKRSRAKFLTVALCFLFAAAALLESFFMIDRQRMQLDPLLGKTVTADITILSPNGASEYWSSYNVLLTREGFSHNALLECDFPTDFSVGETVRGNVLVCPIEDVTESANYYLAKQTYVALQATEDTFDTVGHESPTLSTWLQELNHTLSNTLDQTLEDGAASLCSAISLGEKAHLSDSVIRNFRRTGLSHVLAISGMHLSIIMLALEAFLKRMGLRKEFRCVLVLLTALFYLALTGFSLSTVRAFIMMAFVYAAFWIRNDNDAVTSLFAALFLILLFSPYSVFDIGLWMSFLAVLGILVANYFVKTISNRLYESKCPKKLIRPITYILASVLITLFANVFVFIPMWLFFGEISLIAVVTNLLITPLVTPLLFGTLMLLASAWIPLVSYAVPLIALGLNVISDLILSLTQWFSLLPNIVLSLKYPFAGPVIIASQILLFVALLLPLKRKWIIPLIPTVGALVFCGFLISQNVTNRDTVTVDYVNYNESEMLLLTTVDRTAIVDFSTGSNAYLYETAKLSKARYATEISGLILTHYHTYHVRAFSRNAERFIIRALYLPMPKTKSDYHIMTALIDAAGKANCKVVLYDRESTFEPLDGVTVRASDLYYLKRSTHPTFYLSVTTEQNRLIYLAESAHEDVRLKESIEAEWKTSDYIIFGKHGPVTKNHAIYNDIPNDAFVFAPDSSILSHLYLNSNQKAIIDSSSVTIRLKR